MNKLYILSVIICLSACEPGSGVRVIREGDSYVVEVGACSWRDRAMVVRDLDVRKEAAGLASEATCALTTQRGDLVLERWRYGSDAAGFQRMGCPALERGVAYRIEIGTAPAGTVGRFVIDGNGDVKMIAGDCPKQSGLLSYVP